MDRNHKKENKTLALVATVLSCLLFAVSLIVCMIKGYATYIAVAIGTAGFAVTALCKGFSLKELKVMSTRNIPTMLIVARIMVMIGIMTGLWRSGGTIAFCIVYGTRIIPPSLFIVCAFLLAAIVSYAIGTSFGVASTVGVIVMALARSGGVSEVLTAGAVMSGIYFGDRGAPTSSSASLVAALTRTSHRKNVTRMMKTALLPTLICIILYTGLSLSNPVQMTEQKLLQDIAAEYTLNFWSILPALLMIILPLLHMEIILSMLISSATALFSTIVFQNISLWSALKLSIIGYHPTNAVMDTILGGGGIRSMLPAITVTMLAGVLTGVLEDTRLLGGVQDRAGTLCEKIGDFPAVCLMSFVFNMLMCSQSISATITTEFMKPIYAKREADHAELAIDLENSVITLSGLIPWNIACSVPLAMLQASTKCLPYAFYLYLVPLCYLFTRKRFVGSFEKEAEI